MRCGWLSALVLLWQNDVDFQDFVIAFLLHRYLDVVGVDVHILGNHGHQFLLHGGQEVC